jgi:NDP-sugar pyrophosphorylase family protein
MNVTFSPADYVDLEQTEHPALFDQITHAWEILSSLDLYLERAIVPANHGRMIGSPVIGERVFIGRGTVVEPGVYIKGPAWIGENCQIRHGAYIRENVIVGAGSVVGNSTELKNCVLFQRCQVPHFNYVGDSILGARVHLAAGVIVSNLKLAADFITLRVGDEILATGLRKFGALLGDGAEIGCNAVLNPGTIIGRGSLVYPGVSWRGILPANSIAKDARTVEARRDRPGIGPKSSL